MLWEVRFAVGVTDVILADLDGDGLAEVIVETEDGYVRILRSPAEGSGRPQGTGRIGAVRVR